MPAEITAPVTLVQYTILAPVALAADAYQLAVREGFVGTRAEWLASLIGSGTEDLRLPVGILSLAIVDEQLVITTTEGIYDANLFKRVE